jgi:ADP-heptose:LPS heptosyltransferase
VAEDLLVSCITPTYKRGRFLCRAIEYFARQDYPNRELIVIDDEENAASGPVAEAPGVRHIRLDERKSVGEKRNIGCRAAAGSIILHWDDDDWQAPWRISYQVRELLARGADICGLESEMYLNTTSGEAWRYVYAASARRWVAGNTLCYKRSFWEAHPFADVQVGEDIRFVSEAEPSRVWSLTDSSFIIGIIHPENVSPKHTKDRSWKAWPPAEAYRLMGDDRLFYGGSRGPRNEGEPQALVGVAKGVGDVLRSTPLVRVLRAQGYQVDVLIEADYGDTASLLEGAPEIRRILRTPPQGLEYDVAAFTFWAAKYARAVHSRRTLTFDRAKWLKHGDSFCVEEMARALGWTGSLPRPFAVPSTRQFDLPPGTIALHAGCKPDWPWKKWHGFDELARLLPRVALIGTPADEENSRTYFREKFNWPAHAVSFIGDLDLKDTAALLTQCAALVSNDSGLMHLAAALGLPTFGIFGVTSPAREALQLQNMFAVTKGLDCEPACREEAWGRRDCHRHLECLRTLSAGEVRQRLISVLPVDANQLKPTAVNSVATTMDRLTLVYHGHPFDATGYGAAARAYIHAMHRAGIEIAVRDMSRHSRQVRDELVESLAGRDFIPNFHLFHGIPPEWARDAFRLSNAIGMTVWETDTMPSPWRSALNHVVETWLPCDFNIAAFRPNLARPVFKLPHPVTPRTELPCAESVPGVRDDDFVVYSIFEWQERKFPEGQLAAFLRAFPRGGPVVYVLKSSASARETALRAVSELRRSTGSEARVEVQCEGWGEEQIEALHRRGDCYLSLHRGEGWGYPLFEAVCRGKPVVATAHSGPLEYLSEGAHELVRYSLVRVRQQYVYYNPRMNWAEPDVAQASEQLRGIYENREQARARAVEFSREVQRRYSLEAVGELARARLMELAARCRAGSNGHTAPAPARSLPPHPIPGDWYDADYFENGIKSNWSRGYRWKEFAGLFRDTAALLTSMLPGAHSFLDAGCAKGFLVRALRERGAEAWGFDCSPWAVEHAEPSAKPHLQQATTEQAAFDRTFDVVVAMDLLTGLTEEQVQGFLARARSWTNIGIFATIATEESLPPAGGNGDRDLSHVMRRGRGWWHERFLEAGWRQDPLHHALERAFQRHDLPRNMKWQVFLYSPK